MKAPAMKESVTNLNVDTEEVDASGLNSFKKFNVYGIKSGPVLLQLFKLQAALPL